MEKHCNIVFITVCIIYFKWSKTENDRKARLIISYNPAGELGTANKLLSLISLISY